MSQHFFYPPNNGTVPGTITANQGLPNSDANAWPVKVTDGVDELAVNTDKSINIHQLNTLVPESYDEIDLTYTTPSSTDIATVTYKLATVTVATLTLSYDGNDRLTTVVKT